MNYMLGLLPLVISVLPAAAQDEDVFKTLALGDRVQITFRSGNTLSGQLVVNPIGRALRPSLKPGEAAPEEKIDYTKEPGLTIDLSWEYPGLTGTMTITKREIKVVKKLQAYDPETLKHLTEERARRAKELTEQNELNKKAAAASAAAAEDERKKLLKAQKEADAAAIKEAKDAARLKKLEILSKFPPEAGWGADKLTEINGKAQRKQPLTPQESEFLTSFKDWSEALNIKDEMNKEQEKEKTPPEGKKP